MEKFNGGGGHDALWAYVGMVLSGGVGWVAVYSCVVVVADGFCCASS